MYTRLARGISKDGMRQDLDKIDSIQEELGNIHRTYVEKLMTCGKLSKEEVKTALLQISAFKKDPHHTLFQECFINPKLKSLSSNLDHAIVGGNFSSGPVTIFGHEENVRSYSLFYDRYSRRDIDIRLMECPIYVREHAISRFIERSNSGFSAITSKLWPGLLFVETLHYFSAPAIARPFMIPIGEGAFLGVSALGTPPNNVKGVERHIISAGGIDESIDRSFIDKFMPISILNTFIPIDKMKPSQLELRRALLDLIARHRSVLMVAHLGKIMSFRDEPDGLGLEERFPGDVYRAKEEFEAIMASDIWTSGVRIPNDSQFVNHFIAQGLLERSSVDVIQ